MPIRRTLERKLRNAARQYPVVTVTGPRQSGKTTLVRATFPRHAYISLEAPDDRAFAVEDPRGFLSQFRGPAILDEIQRAPDLFSYLQPLVDEDPRPGRFVLTGSQNFLLLQSISQTLAGRTAVLHLLPFSLAELAGRPPPSLDGIGSRLPRAGRRPPSGLHETLFAGFYPRIHDRGLDPSDWLAEYVQTYLERDVRNVLSVGDLETFSRFIRLAAARSGQLLNLSNLAVDCGVTHTTARRWISVLEASFVVLLLRPHHRNFGKRLVKAPKLYLLDTGLLCYLLRIHSPDELRQHATRGAIFKTFVVSEIHKNFVHRGEPSDLYFWRDSTGHEVDVVCDLGARLLPIEAKSSETVVDEFFAGLEFWRRLAHAEDAPAALVYAGDRAMRRRGTVVLPWHCL